MDSAHPEPLNNGVKAIMLVGGVCVAMAMMAITPVLPKIEEALAHGPGDRLLVKLLVTVMGFSMVAGAPLAGVLIDRIGMRRVLLTACGLYILAGTAGLYLNSLPSLIASRLLVGAAAAAIATTSMTLINTRLDHAGRARWMGLHVATATLSGVLLQPLVGYVGEFGWRWPFAVFFLAAPLGLVALWLPGPIRHSIENRTARSDGSLRFPRQFPLPYILLALAIGSISFLPAVYLPFVLRKVGVSSPSIVALVMLADTLLTALLATQFVRAQRRISSTAAFVFSFACTGVGLITVALSSGLPGIVAGMMVFGLGLGWFVPNLMTAAARRVPLELQGRTVGWIKAAHYLAAPVATVLVEPITRQFGPSSAMLVAGVLALCLLGLFTLRLATPVRSSRPARAARRS